jgi:putative antitoxin of VapBC-like toxin-antitoxin system
MRTNIEIDDELVAEAQKLSGQGTKKRTVEEALRLMIIGTPITLEGNGSHSHIVPGHGHTVTGKISALGGGERKGTAGYNAPHEGNVLSVKGETSVTTQVKIDGGQHDHRRVGFRLCRIKG